MGKVLPLFRALPPGDRTRVTIHCDQDDCAVVTLKPQVPGLPARRFFSSYDDAWPWADEIARHHSRKLGIGGSSSHSVAINGPESAEA